MKEKLFCPICGSELDINGTMSKCPVCGYTASVKSVRERESHVRNADDEIELYRLLSSADEFFAQKRYDEAYIAYGSVLDADGSCIKARFRRELTSRYLMIASSSVYLSCNDFFDKMKEIKAAAEREADEKLSLVICRDMINYISMRADYEKKYASLHKNEKTAASYMSDTLLLFEYNAEIIKYLKEKTNIKNLRERALMITDGYALGMKIRAMLLSGAEYVQTSENMDDLSGEQAAKNVSRIKRRRLSQKDEVEVETVTGNMRKAKNDMMNELPAELLAEIKALEEKNEKAEKAGEAEEDKKRIDYEIWRQRNEREYMAADKRIILFDILGKGAAVMAAVMALFFAVELIAFDRTIAMFLIFAVVFIAANAVFGILKKNAKKKKGFYSKVIEGDSANMRAYGKDFKE